MALDLGSLFATVDVITAPGERKLAVFMRTLSTFGGSVDKAAANVRTLDTSLADSALAADKATVSIDREGKATAAASVEATRAAAAERKRAAALAEGSAAAARFSALQDSLVGKSKAEQAAAYRAAAAEERRAAAVKTGTASFAQLSSTQAAAIAASKRYGAAQETLASRAQATGSKWTRAATIPVLAAAAVSVKLASDFQQATSVYVTAAGESQKNLGVVRAGIKRVAIETGTSITQLTAAEYLAEKAHLRGADGIKVLSAAAKGAREENANLADVMQGETSIMASYHLTADQAVAVTNALKTGAGSAKTTMEEYVKSLSTVIPVASAAGIGLDQLLGAVSTLTQHGTNANEATQELSNTIRNLQAPNNVAVAAMNQLGISSVNVSRNLGKRGLTGTIQYIESKLPKTGLVYLTAMRQMESGTSDLNQMVTKMPPSLAKLSKGFLDGSVSAKDYRTAFKNLGAEGFAQGSQFLSLASKVKGYNDSLRNGTPAQKTMVSLLKAMFGGANGLNTVLQLGGKNLDGFKGRVDAVGKSLHDTTGNVEGWSSTSKLAAVRADMLKQRLHVLGIDAGNTLLPAGLKLVGMLSGLVHWISGLSHTDKAILGWSVLAVAAVGPLLSIFGRVATLLRLLPGLFATAGSSAALAGTRMGASVTTAGRVVGGAQVGGLGLGAGLLGSGAVAGHVNGSSVTGALATLGAGTASGALVGAAAGSVIPGVGTAVGAGVGAIAGTIAGVITAFHHMDDASKSAAVHAKAALDAQNASASSLLSTLESVNGAYNQQVRGNVTSQLNSSGALGIASKAGVNLQNLVSGVLGEGGPKALAALNVQLENAAAKGKITFGQLAKVQQALGTVGAGASKAETQLELENRAMHGAVLTADQYGTSLTKLKNVLVGGAVKSFDTTSAAGQRNTAVLRDNINHLNALASTQLKAKVPASQVASAYLSQINALQRNSVALGANKDDVQSLISKYAKVPPSVVTALRQQGIATINPALLGLLSLYARVPASKSTTVRVIDHATGTLTTIRQMVAGLHDRSITVTTRTQTVGGGVSVSTGHFRTNAKGTSGLPDGYFTVGERGWELGYKSGSHVEIFPNSASRAMTGWQNVPGFATGTGNVSGVVSAVNSLGGVVRAGRKNTTGVGVDAINADMARVESVLRVAGGSSALINKLKQENKTLDNLAHQRNLAASALARATAAVAAAKDVRKQDTATFKGAVTGSFDITNAGQDANGRVTSGSLRSAQGQQVTRVKAWVAGMKRLIGLKVFPSAYLRTLLGAGPGSLSTVTALLGMSKSDLTAFANNEKTIDSLGASVASAGAHKLDDPAITKAQAQQKAAKQREEHYQHALEAGLTHVAHQIEAALHRKVHATFDWSTGSLYLAYETDKAKSSHRKSTHR